MKHLLGDAGRVRLLVVDDERPHRELLREVFPEEVYHISEAENGLAALEVLAGKTFDAVILDNNMPVLNGIETCRRIRENKAWDLLPVIMVTAMNTPIEIARVLKAGATDFVGKPYSPLELESRVRAAAWRKRATDQLDNAEAILFTLGLMVEARDHSTGNHCQRLAHLGTQFGQFLGLSQEGREALRRGGFLHDIGKLAIPDAILLKQGGLDDGEWQVMRKHSAIGSTLCEPLTSMREVLPIIRHHHERFDGSGYPDGLPGGETPELARIFQILDIFDALTNARPYKPAFSLEKSLQILQADAAKGWLDGVLVTAFVSFCQQHPERLVGSGGDGVDSWFRKLMQSGLLAETRFG